MHSILRDCQTGDVTGLAGTAKAEGMTPEALARSIAAGRTILLKNAKRNYTPCAIGEGTKVKVNVNIGTFGQRCDPAMEMEKAASAIANGADAIMDLSTG